MLPGFTAIRVYALRRSLCLGFLTFTLSIVPVGANFVNPCIIDASSSCYGINIYEQVYFWSGLIGENISPLGCTEIISASTDLVNE